MNAYLARCASLAILALRHGHVALALRLWALAGQSRHGLTLD